MSIEEQIIQMNSNNKKIVDNSIAIYNKGVEDGEALGRKAEYNAFWDVAQENGNRTNYAFAFSGDMWTQENFKPKYPIRPVGSAHNMLAYWGQSYGGKGSTRIDLRGICAFELEKCTSINSMCYSNTYIKAIGILDTRNINALETVFSSAYNIETIEKIILKDDGSQTFANNFRYCEELTNLTIEGVIGQNGLNLQWSTKLSKNSWISIINALSTTTSGLTITGSLASVKKAFETSAGANDGNTSAEWKALTDTKTNWTISLV